MGFNITPETWKNQKWKYYRGKKTFFYDGRRLGNVGDINGDDFDERYTTLIYDKAERDSWEIVIVLPGVEVIPDYTFFECQNIKEVFMSNSVERIENSAFEECENLCGVELSSNLKYMGNEAFYNCLSLCGIAIPPSCEEIGHEVFCNCESLRGLDIPEYTKVGNYIIKGTELLDRNLSLFTEYKSQSVFDAWYPLEENENVNNWIKGVHQYSGGEQYALHRACFDSNPNIDSIYQIMKKRGSLRAFRQINRKHRTPSWYLHKNPFAKNIDEKKIITRYILEMVGEII